MSPFEEFETGVLKVLVDKALEKLAGATEVLEHAALDDLIDVRPFREASNHLRSLETDLCAVQQSLAELLADQSAVDAAIESIRSVPLG